jgi:hypothetical protein
MAHTLDYSPAELTPYAGAELVDSCGYVLITFSEPTARYDGWSEDEEKGYRASVIRVCKEWAAENGQYDLGLLMVVVNPYRDSAEEYYLSDL